MEQGIPSCPNRPRIECFPYTKPSSIQQDRGVHGHKIWPFPPQLHPTPHHPVSGHTELWLVPGVSPGVSHLGGFALAVTSWNELPEGLPGKLFPTHQMTLTSTPCDAFPVPRQTFLPLSASTLHSTLPFIRAILV